MFVSYHVGAWHSPYCERVWLGLLEKGLEFDEVLIELQGRKVRTHVSNCIYRVTKPMVYDIINELCLLYQI